MYGLNIEITKALISAGGGLLIARVILYGVYKLMHRFGGQFVQAQQAQAEALAKQAVSMEGLRDSIQMFVNRDNSEHREMLVLLKYIAQHQESLEEVKRSVNSCGKCKEAN